ncbi:MAG: hypothetical protein ACE37K_11965 [Planctomycetota bacterium]
MAGEDASNEDRERALFAGLRRQVKQEQGTRSKELSQDEEDQKKDRELRGKFMMWMLGILIGLLTVVNVGVLALASFQLLQLDAVTLRIWLTATLVQAYGIVLVIAKYLFPQQGQAKQKPRTRPLRRPN